MVETKMTTTTTTMPMPITPLLLFLGPYEYMGYSLSRKKKENAETRLKSHCEEEVAMPSI